ncbi:MAG: ribose 5-phosphate isomerase B [Ruminococcaceae bacterium]|nr:ribose 5-phosphate isomerase B [Oscillospiraceae bacterium]
MLAIGCDHGGVALKNQVLQWLRDNNIEYKDFGTNTEESINYAPIAVKVARSITSGECDRGILICGTGIGMSLAANKVKGIRAAVCSNSFEARYTRLHNDANILCLGARVIGLGVAIDLIYTFLNTHFEGGRHQERIDEIAKIENGEM